MYLSSKFLSVETHWIWKKISWIEIRQWIIDKRTFYPPTFFKTSYNSQNIKTWQKIRQKPWRNEIETWPKSWQKTWIFLTCQNCVKKTWTLLAWQKLWQKWETKNPNPHRQVIWLIESMTHQRQKQSGSTNGTVTSGIYVTRVTLVTNQIVTSRCQFHLNCQPFKKSYTVKLMKNLPM